MPIKIRLYYFAKVKEITNKQSEIVEIEAESLNTDEVFNIVRGLYKDKEADLDLAFTNCLIALNDEYIGREEQITLKENDEVSILPPISAG